MEYDTICRQHGQKCVAVCYVSTAVGGQNPDQIACPACLADFATLSGLRVLSVEPVDAANPWVPDGVSARDLYGDYGPPSRCRRGPQELLRLLGVNPD